MESKPRKRISYDADGEVHEFTFSTYRRRPILCPDPEACRAIPESVEAT